MGERLATNRQFLSDHQPKSKPSSRLLGPSLSVAIPIPFLFRAPSQYQISVSHWH